MEIGQSYSAQMNSEVSTQISYLQLPISAVQQWASKLILGGRQSELVDLVRALPIIKEVSQLDFAAELFSMEEIVIKELLEVAEIVNVEATWQQSLYLTFRKELNEEANTFAAFLSPEHHFNMRDLSKHADALFRYQQNSGKKLQKYLLENRVSKQIYNGIDIFLSIQKRSTKDYIRGQREYLNSFVFNTEIAEHVQRPAILSKSEDKEKKKRRNDSQLKKIRPEKLDTGKKDARKVRGKSKKRK